MRKNVVGNYITPLHYTLLNRRFTEERFILYFREKSFITVRKTVGKISRACSFNKLSCTSFKVTNICRTRLKQTKTISIYEQIKIFF